MDASYLMRSRGAPSPLRDSSGSLNVAHLDSMPRCSQPPEMSTTREHRTSPPGTRPSREYVLLMPVSLADDEERSLRLHRERQQLQREKHRWRLQQQIEESELRSREEAVARREQALDSAERGHTSSA